MKTSVGGPAIALDEDDVEAVESPEVDDFDLDEPDGQDVFTAGISVDFDSWDPTKLHILPLGGCGNIGMNMTLYGYGNEYILVDAGQMMAERLEIPGVVAIVPDVSCLAPLVKSGRLKALIITHAHDDHTGGLEHLWPNLRIPVYATKFTANMVRFKIFEQTGYDIEWKLIRPSPTVDSDFQVGPFDISMFPVTHSMPECYALVLRTPAGIVLHTGDWKLDHEPQVGDPMNLDELKKLGDEGVLAIVGDSTNATRPGHSISEGEVRRSIIALFKEIEEDETCKGAIIVTCFATNVARLETIAIAARSVDRHVAVTGRSLLAVRSIASVTGYLSDLNKHDSILDADDTWRSYPREKQVVICTGCQGEPNSALQRAANGKHPWFNPGNGDTVIFSSSAIPGNEFNVNSIKSNLAEAGVYVIDNTGPYLTHATGHPHEDELRQMYECVRPRFAIPVHGEHKHQLAHAQIAKEVGAEATILKDGEIYSLSKSEVRQVGAFDVAYLGSDGSDLTPISRNELEQPNQRAAALVVITIRLDQDKRLAEAPRVSIRASKRSVQTRVPEVVVEVAAEITQILALEKLRHLDANSLNEKVTDEISQFAATRLGGKVATLLHIEN